MLLGVFLCKISIHFARYCTLPGGSVARAQGTAVRTVVAEIPAYSMPSCADTIGTLKIAVIHAQHHLYRSFLLTHTTRLVLLDSREHALEVLLAVVVHVRLSQIKSLVARRG
jgi:hypothetical protein